MCWLWPCPQDPLRYGEDEHADEDEHEDEDGDDDDEDDEDDEDEHDNDITDDWLLIKCYVCDCRGKRIRTMITATMAVSVAIAKIIAANAHHNNTHYQSFAH